MGLGDKLREAIERLRNSSVIDKDAVKEAIKELQRALISANVEVALVQELSKKIEEQAFKDLPKGITRREHVVKTTYDLLSELLGGESKAPQNPQKILLVGLYGNGKCVDPDSRITLSDGTIKTIEEIYALFDHATEKDSEGFKINLQKNELKVPSMNLQTYKIESKSVETIWKLKSPPKLYEVCVDNGNNHTIITTPEHPFFVLDEGEIKNIRADSLKEGSYIALPYNTPFKGSKNISLHKEFVRLCDNFSIEDKLNLKEHIRTKCYKKYGTLTKAHKMLGISAQFPGFTHKLKHAEYIPLEYVKKAGIKLPKSLKSINATMNTQGYSKFIRIPLEISDELCEFMGYVFGDGYVNRSGVEITNQDTEIINRSVLLSKKLFNIKPRLERDKRRKKLMRIRIFSRTILFYLHNLFGLPVGKKSHKMKIPDKLLELDKSSFKHFIRAYVDCDGHMLKNERSIELTTASKEFAYQLQTILLRYGIATNFSEKKVKENKYYRLHLTGRSAERYGDKIGSSVSYKHECLKKMKQIGIRQGEGKNDLLFVGKQLKLLRELYGQTIGHTQRTVKSYGIYENNGVIPRRTLKNALKSLKKGKQWTKILAAIKSGNTTYSQLEETTGFSKPFLNAILYRLEQTNAIHSLVSPNPGKYYSLTRQGKELLMIPGEEKTIISKKMDALANSDVLWRKVRTVKKIKTRHEYVYDLTVPKNHNFIANNVIVHNTTTSAKLAKYYLKRGKRVGVICADSFRPAAFDQLKQLSEKIQVPFYGNPKKKNAAKIVEEGLKELKDKELIIVDSAGRNALDKELSEEIKEINSVLKPDQNWLVLGGDIGQIAKKQATAFHEAVGVNGVILTRMDGSAKGGGALAACKASSSPVYFLGVGEKIDDLIEFDSQRYLSKIMGYGDLEGLLEKVKEIELEETGLEQMMEGKFNLQLFYDQLKAARQMGPLDKVMDMMGLKAQIPKEQLDISEKKLDSFKVVMDSMTKKEKEEPDILNKPRMERIVQGSGKKVEEIRELLKHYRQMEKMFKKVGKLTKMPDLKEGKLQKIFGKIAGMKKKKKFKIR